MSQKAKILQVCPSTLWSDKILIWKFCGLVKSSIFPEHFLFLLQGTWSYVYTFHYTLKVQSSQPLTTQLGGLANKHRSKTVIVVKQKVAMRIRTQQRVYGRAQRQERDSGNNVFILLKNFVKKLKQILWSCAPETRDLYQSTPSTTHIISLRVYILNLENKLWQTGTHHFMQLFYFT